MFKVQKFIKTFASSRHMYVVNSYESNQLEQTRY